MMYALFDIKKDRPPVPETGWCCPASFPDLSSASAIAIDLETCDPDLKTKGPGVRRDGYIVGLAVGVPDGGRWYFPMRHEGGGNLDPGMVLRWAKAQLCNPRQPKVGANLMYDVDYLWAAGVPVAGPLIDVQIAEPLLDENRYSYSLDALAEKYLGERKVSSELYEWASRAFGGQPTAKDQGGNIWRCPPELVGPYAEGDVDLPLRIWQHQRKALEAEGLLDLFWLESANLYPLLEMRRQGVRVNYQRADEVQAIMLQREQDAQSRLNAEAGQQVDVWANESIARAYSKAGLWHPTTDKGNPSFTKVWLEQSTDPIAQHINAVRKWSKNRGTFVEGYVQDYAINGRLHALFHPLRNDEYGTVSGRFSCSNPNLQNIPSRDKELQALIRSLFIPEDGHTWRRFDWSQIEYRLLAHYARGPGATDIVRAYHADPKTDYHEATRQLIKAMTGREISRKHTKNINFGLCIAKGELVLTDSGLIPIECVKDWHKLWDGVEWVNHSGVIYRGEKEVLHYGGLRATKEHEIWTQEGRKIPFWRAASEGRELARTGKGADAIRPWNIAYFEGDDSTAQRRNSSGRLLQFLRKIAQALRIQRPVKEDNELPLPEKIQGPAGIYSGPALRCNDTTLQPLDALQLKKLYWAWHKGFIRIARGLCVLGLSKMAGYGLQRIGFRPGEQRWPLFKKQLEVGDKVGKPEKQAVYDIMNAGPRRRFTCSDVLVSNCYGMGADSLCAQLGVDSATGADLFETYHQAVPFVKKTFDYASSRARTAGYVRTILGRRARFDEWEPADWKQRGETSKNKQTIVDNYGRAIRAGTHKALNRVLQGSSADMMKKALCDAHKSGVFDVIGHPLTIVHDEFNFSDDGTPEAAEAFRVMKHIMETCIPLKIPVLADEESGPNWGELKKS